MITMSAAYNRTINSNGHRGPQPSTVRGSLKLYSIAIGRLDLKINQDGVEVLRQRMGRVTQLGLLTRALLGQLGLGISGRLMGGVGTALTAEVHRRITRIVRWLTRSHVLALEALERSPRLDQRAVHREVLVGERFAGARLRDHGAEELTGDRVLQQPRAVARKGRMVEARLVHLQIQKPAEQKVVVELLAKQPLAAHRLQRHQQRGFQQPLRRNRRPSYRAVQLIEHHQHRPLPPLLTAHPPLPPPPRLPTQTNYTKMIFRRFSTPC